MSQLLLFDVKADKPVAVVLPSVTQAPPKEIGERIAWEGTRGEFAYWSLEAEARWRAMAGERPSVPDLPGVSRWSCRVRPNSRAPGVWDDPYTWDRMLECGRSYMVGKDVPMEQFIRSHRSAMIEWQKVAYAWARANPLWRLCVDTAGKEWEVSTEGEYVVVALPHHDSGGERHYVSNNGRSKILVNVD